MIEYEIHFESIILVVTRITMLFMLKKDRIIK